MTTSSVSPDSDNLKRCCHCHEWKPREEFGRDRSRPDGLHNKCKACNAAYRASNHERLGEYQHEYRAANAERIAEQKREYAAMNAEHIAEYQREYYAANAESAREYAREYRAANQKRINERQREYQREYYVTNTERIHERQRGYRQTPGGKASQRARVHRRRARKLAVGGTYTPADLAAIRAAQTDGKGRLICWACGKPIKDAPHLDHWIPLAKGGANDAGNLHYMHAKCNQTKSAKHPTELGRLI